MNFWTAAVIVVALWAIVSVIRSRGNAAASYATDEDGNPVGKPEREAELEAEVEALRERIQVLERIATDDREATRLSSEIDKLRD